MCDKPPGIFGFEVGAGVYGYQRMNVQDDLVREATGQLIAWKESGVIGEVILPWRTYSNMAIETINTTRDPTTGNSIKIQIGLRSVRIVESRLVTAPVPTEVRGKTMKPKGRQPVSEVFGDPADKTRQKSMMQKLWGRNKKYGKEQERETR